MGIEAQTKNQSSSMKEFKSLLEADFKGRKLKKTKSQKQLSLKLLKNLL